MVFLQGHSCVGDGVGHNIFLYFQFYHEVFNGSCAFISSVLSTCFLLSPPPLVSEHFSLLCPGALLWSTCSASAIPPPCGFLPAWKGAHWMFLSPDGQLPFSLPVVTLLWLWSPFHLLGLHPHLSGSPSFWSWLLVGNLSVLQRLGPRFLPCFCLAVILCGSYCG